MSKELACKLSNLEDAILKASKTLAPFTKQNLKDSGSYAFYYQKNPTLTSWHILRFTILGEVPVDAILFYAPNRPHYFTDEINVTTSFDLKLHLFSDSETYEAYIQLVNTRSSDIGYVDTTYFFDKAGRYAKLAQLPISLQTNRKSVIDHPLVGIYLSEITLNDFDIAEQALECILKSVGSAQGSDQDILMKKC